MSRLSFSLGALTALQADVTAFPRQDLVFKALQMLALE